MKEQRYKVEFSGENEILSQYADSVLVQSGEDVVTLLFYQNLIPLAGRTGEDGAISAKSQCIGKFVISQKTTESLKDIIEKQIFGGEGDDDGDRSL